MLQLSSCWNVCRLLNRNGKAHRSLRESPVSKLKSYCRSILPSSSCLGWGRCGSEGSVLRWVLNLMRGLYRVGDAWNSDVRCGRGEGMAVLQVPSWRQNVEGSLWGNQRSSKERLVKMLKSLFCSFLCMSVFLSAIFSFYDQTWA